MTEHHSHEQTLTDYFAVLKRRKWIVLLAVVIAPAVAVAMSLSQPKLFTATASVLLTSSPTGVYSPVSASVSAAEIASSPAVAERVVKATHLTTRSVGQLLSEASFSGSATSDVLAISITDGDPVLAVTLANAYAQEYVQYRRAFDTAFLDRTRKEIQGRIDLLRASGQTNSPLYALLVQKDLDLLETAALQTSTALVLRPAGGAAQVQPTPKRNGIMGFGVGLVLALALALLWDALDTRVRSAHEVSTILGQPLLGRLSAPPRKVRSAQGIVMLEDAVSPESEAFRQLRTSFDFANVDAKAKVIMVTSALQGEGKSTTAANLAVALARAGREVVLVDLDLREPILQKLFKLQGYRWVHGLTSVALGRVELEDAIAYLPVGGGERGRSEAEGGSTILQVLPSGPVPGDPGEFVASGAVRGVIDRLRERAEIVVIDAPPLLGVHDAASLSAGADGIVMVARLGMLRRPLLREARRILDTSPAAKLGFVLTGAEREEGYGDRRYGYYYRPSPVAIRTERRDERQRV
jgi:succinoglycan biosynthesis transport protein ExoP